MRGSLPRRSCQESLPNLRPMRSMYSLLCNVENLIVTPPVPRLSIGMHQGASLAPALGRHKGPLNLFYLRENT